MMKRNALIALGLAAVTLLALAACSHGAAPSEAGKDQPAGKVEMIPNPFKDCESLEAAEALTGFSLELSQEPERVAVMDNSMIEAVLKSGASVRKAAGDGDISGDYTAYARTETVDGITLKGEQDRFSLAVWTADGYTYAVSLPEGVTQDELIGLAKGIH